MNTAIILNRSPLITRTPSIFERAYYAYQARIQRALHNPFPYDFWFKQGSPLETRFRAEELKKERNAFGKPFGMPAMDAEGNIVGPSYEDAGLQEEDEESMPRVHPADTKGDVRSLDRKGQRNLYLLIKSMSEDEKEVWKFPQGEVEKNELLHEVSPIYYWGIRTGLILTLWG
jgi:large subunit ribosomal protein L46